MKEDKAIELTKQIDRYLAGKLTQAEIEILWEELIADSDAYEQFETTLHLKSLILEKAKEQTDTKPPQSRGRYKKVFWIWPAAALLLLSLFLYLFSISQRTIPAELALSEIDYREMLSAEIHRSSSQSASETDVAMNEALALAYGTQLQESAEAYNRLLERDLTTDQRLIAGMNLGILHFNLGNFEEAAARFKSVSDSEPENHFIHEQALWYFAHTLIRLNDIGEARDRAFEVYHFNGRYSEEALALVGELDRFLVGKR